MFRLSRMVVAPALLLGAAISIAVAPSAFAQPPGFDKGKGGFDKGGFGKGFDKGFEKSKEKAPPAAPTPGPDAVKNLEADLAKLKALEADILAQLRKLKEAPAPAPAEKRGQVAGAEGRGPGGPPGGFGRGGFGPGGFGPGGFGGRFGERGAPAGGTPRGTPGIAQGISRAFQGLSATQLKEVINELEKLRAEKLQAETPASRERRPEGRGPEGRGTPPGRPAAPTPAPSSNEEILKRLDRLSRELDDIRKSLKK